MIARLRAFCREESLGLVIPAGFIVLYALWNVIEALSVAFVYPILARAFRDEGDEFNFERLDFTIGDVPFDWTNVSYEVPAFLLLVALVYYLVMRPIPEESVDMPEEGMRPCPECFSEIVVEARRCPFCTATVEPLTGEAAL